MLNFTRAHHTVRVIQRAMQDMPIREVLSLLEYLWVDALRHIPKKKRTEVIDAMIAVLVNAGYDLDAEAGS